MICYISYILIADFRQRLYLMENYKTKTWHKILDNHHLKSAT